MNMQNKNILFILFILIVIFVGIFLYSDHVPVDFMEPRNYIAAREMIESGSWLLPTMEGKLRIAKPPLPTWITALAMMWAGTDTNLTADRIPAGICALLLCIFTFLIVKRVSGDRRIAVASLLILATNYLFMLAARRNEWDIYAYMAMAGAVWALLEALMRKNGKPIFFLLFSLFMAVSFYSKGPVAFWAMLLPFLISYIIAYGPKALLENKGGLVWSFILCALLSGLWPLYVYVNAPHVAASVASQESSAWFKTSINPFWAYLANMYKIVGIWLPLLLYGMAVPFIEKEKKPEEKLFAFWFILTVFSLSIFPEKRMRYILPAVVPGSVIPAMVIYRLREARGWAWKIVYGAFCMIAGILFAAVAGILVYYSPGKVHAIPGAVLLGLVGGALVYQFVARKTKNAHITAIVGVCLCVVFLLPMVSQLLGPDDARKFMHVRENPELMQRDFCVMPQDLLSDTVTYDIRWAIAKNIQSVIEYHANSWTKKGKIDPYVLITAQNVERRAKMFKWRLADKITTKRATYYIYLIP